MLHIRCVPYMVDRALFRHRAHSPPSRVSAGLLGLSPLPSVVHGPEATPAPRQIGATNGPSGPGLWITATPSVDGSHRSSNWVAWSNQVDIPCRLVDMYPYTSGRPIPPPAELVRLWSRTRTHPARRRRQAAVHNPRVTAYFRAKRWRSVGRPIQVAVTVVPN